MSFFDGLIAEVRISNVARDFSPVSTTDCNANGVPDHCDVVNGTSLDRNSDGRPDECESESDFDQDGDVDLADFLFLTGCLRGPGNRLPRECCQTSRRGPCISPADLDRDGDVDLTDVIIFQASFTGSR